MTLPRRALATSCAAVLLAALGACTRSPPTGPRANLILISVDTLRADHLGCYGSSRGASPAIDRLASESWVFDAAYAQSTNTLISHATMLTSLYPPVHGATPERRLTDQVTTLPEVLQDAGYRTAAFLGHDIWLTRAMGFAQGFDHFSTRPVLAEKTNRDVLSWPGLAEDGPFFLFLHYYDVHSRFTQLPYNGGRALNLRFAGPSPPDFDGCRRGLCASELLVQANGDSSLLSENELRWVVGLYDAGIAAFDRRLGQLIDALEARGVLDTSWIILTADHGEEFREHGLLLHLQPYPSVARVPLLIRPPGGREETRVAEIVRHVDLFPTVLDLLRVTPPAGASPQGRSLVPLLEGEPNDPRTAVTWGEPMGQPVALRRGTATLVLRTVPAVAELFVRDPVTGQETRKVAPLIAGRLARNLQRFERMQEQARTDLGLVGLPADLSPAQRQRLRSLGYVQ
ncbi:MAG: sulfatase [Thermoanaerobaculia bacterium]